MLVLGLIEDIFPFNEEINCLLQGRHQANNMDSHSAQSTDEAFLSKESSQEELDERLEADDRDQDSEECV
jgi:hypothetical protein